MQPRERLATVGVWLTCLAVASGGLGTISTHSENSPHSTIELHRAPAACALDEAGAGQPAEGRGQELSDRNGTQVVLATSASQWQLLGGRFKAASSPVLEKPKTDRHRLLALERSAVTSRTACVPLLRSTHLQI